MNAGVHCAEILLGEIIRSFIVFLGHDKRVSYRDRIFVKNGYEIFILVDNVGIRLPLNDVAEDAAQIDDESFGQRLVKGDLGDS